MNVKHAVQAQFGRMSHEYVRSPGHARGDDLARLVELLSPMPGMRVLDVATGGGHTAVAAAAGGASVVATDIAREMLSRTREQAAERGVGLTAVLADAEQLPFPAKSFDGVTCRIAPHHFPDVPAFVREVARVLRPSGQFVLGDSCAPDDPVLDEFINRVEKLRDPTHGRSLSQARWRELLAAAGLQIDVAEIYRKTRKIGAWMDRSGLADPARRYVLDAFAQAPPAACDYFQITSEKGIPDTYTDDKLILRAGAPPR